MSRVLVTGAGGQLGSELRALEKDYPGMHFYFFDRSALSLDDRAAMATVFGEIKPDICLNAAAYTAVDKAESEKELAFDINATAVGWLAELCAQHRSLLVHVSTDYVFDGTGHTPYTESDQVSPLGVYGASKLKGEQLAAAAHNQVVIVRTSWVYSYFGKNFVKTMLRLLKEKESLGVVNDQVGRPTYAADLARAILDICDDYPAQAYGVTDDRFNGTYHYADAGVISWYDLTCAIKAIIGSDCQVKPITSAEYPTPAKRPSYSVLDTTKIETVFGVQVPDWKDSLKRCLTKLTN